MDWVYFITYDICDKNRLRRVAKVMENYGIRVQKSKFEIALSDKNLWNLKSDLLQEIDPVEDGVKFFKLCPKCQQRTILIGKNVNPDLLETVKII